MPDAASSEASDRTDRVAAFAVRRVNPFLGVLQIIQCQAGRAVSANGVVWDIEVQAEPPPQWGSLNSESSQPAYYRYGLWSQDDGLVNRPLAPHLDSDPLTRQCNELIAHIEVHQQQLPFDLQDSHELWLFDTQNSMPIALLASCTRTSQRPSPAPRYWSATIGAEGVPSQRRYPQAKALEAQVKQRAGFNIHRHWVHRQADGSGLLEDSSDQLTADDFPPFLLTENWPEAGQADLVSGFIQWTAPSLLTLPHLTHSQRRRLERSLGTQAISVEHHWHPYPEILDPARLQTARVQARLQEKR